jgi:hypothetical protein
VAELSPAAQAVLEAFHKELPPDNEPGGLAAAIKSLADQVVPGSRYQPIFMGATAESRWEERQLTRRQLLAIAAELRGTTTP